LKLGREIEWLFEDMLVDLDYNDSATITYDDLADFFRENYQYEIDSSIPDQASTQKLEADPFKYKLEAKDYYREGCTTILNSETAALCKCIELEAKSKKGEKWRDPDFGPLSDKKNGAFSIYYNGED
jgi:hypothetical protein